MRLALVALVRFQNEYCQGASLLDNSIRMTISTRLAFKMLLRRFGADCVCDIGACDGYESLVFRQILPTAVLVAFEANPYLFQKLTADSRFLANRIGIYPYAIASSNGTAPFHVPDLDYIKAKEEIQGIGSGSL